MNPIDEYVGLRALKGAVDAKYKEAEANASDFFAENEKQGISAITSPMFGDAGGEFKRGKTKAKTVVEWNNTDWEDFDSWLDDNSAQLSAYLFQNYKPFCEWWFERTGEVPDGISRVEYTEPSKPTAPKLYRFDQQGVLDVISDGGNLFEKANALLLGE